MELKNFKQSEFECNCGCGMTIVARVACMLDQARERTRRMTNTVAGIPFRITSGARCPQYNDVVVKASKTSSHRIGLAADIAFRNSHEKFVILFALYDAGFRRMGINEDKKFIHVDDDRDKPQQVLFKY